MNEVELTGRDRPVQVSPIVKTGRKIDPEFGVLPLEKRRIGIEHQIEAFLLEEVAIGASNRVELVQPPGQRGVDASLKRAGGVLRSDAFDQRVIRIDGARVVAGVSERV